MLSLHYEGGNQFRIPNRDPLQQLLDRPSLDPVPGYALVVKRTIVNVVVEVQPQILAASPALSAARPLRYEAVLPEPALGDGFGGFPLDFDGVVQTPQGFGVELLGDGVEEFAKLRVVFERLPVHG